MLYPRCCPLCHEILKNQKALVCSQCAQGLKPVTGPRCMKCGKPVGEEEEYCNECAAHPRKFTEGRGIFLYDDLWRASLVRYKYYGRREYGNFYGEAICRFARREILRWNPGLIIPVPLHRRKERMRGFNQSALLAARVGQITGISVDDTLVKKVRSTDSQKKLGAAQRRRNLQTAFVVERRVDGVKILVIDDVYTTGSTMDAMAACLVEQGAEKVFFLTVCMGR